MKKGFFSIESLLIFMFVTMLGITVYSVYQFIGTNPSSEDIPDLISAYQNLVEKINADARFSGEIAMQDNTLTLSNAGKGAITYNITGGNMTRTDSVGDIQIIFKGIQMGGFSIYEKTKGLFSLWLIPSDTLGMPFFTSFAVRKGKR